MKQSSIDWFYQQLVDRQNGHGDSRSIDEIFQQAKAMHKEETCQFAVDWFQDCPIGGDVNSTEDAEDYYKDKFES